MCIKRFIFDLFNHTNQLFIENAWDCYKNLIKSTKHINQKTNNQSEISHSDFKISVRAQLKKTQLKKILLSMILTNIMLTKSVRVSEKIPNKILILQHKLS